MQNGKLPVPRSEALWAEHMAVAYLGLSVRTLQRARIYRFSRWAGFANIAGAIWTFGSTREFAIRPPRQNLRHSTGQKEGRSVLAGGLQNQDSKHG
jgi:hypothetical protein